MSMGQDLRQDPGVTEATHADREALAAMLARAFHEDPVFTWLFPDAVVRSARLPGLFAFLSDGDAAGMRWRTHGGEAATLWMRSVDARVGSLVPLLVQAPLLIRLLGMALWRGARLHLEIERHFPPMERASPMARGWYLHVAGCDPKYQGKGFGARAVRAGLTWADQEGVPVHLETANPANLGFYANLGFEVIEEWAITGGPRFWTMARAARPQLPL